MIKIFLLYYLLGMMILAMWMCLYMRSTLDQLDWAYRRSEIWVSFWLKLLFWPLIMMFKPLTFIRPDFGYKQKMFSVDYAGLERQRSQFMKALPPCSSTVSYRTYNDQNNDVKAIFCFDAISVNAMAEKIGLEYQSLEGMYAAMRWTSNTDASIVEPTEVPELLVNFDHIAEGLIDDKCGQVTCIGCNKTYATSDLIRETSFIGSWLWAYYLCPAQHTLLSREIAHFMFKRNYD